ncbi:MAG: hypothetical protein WBG92_16580 [Thiohalocapsa sp.]
MCSDSALPKPDSGELAVAPDDPTLEARIDRPLTDAVFPETAEGAHLVLFQGADGGVELRWHVDDRALAHARIAFGDGPDVPLAVLRLRRLDGEVGSRLIAEASLEDGHLQAPGLARWPASSGAGLLQAEIGLSNAAGGWVLIARSNQLQLTNSVGADFLLLPASASSPPSPHREPLTSWVLSSSPVLPNLRQPTSTPLKLPLRAPTSDVRPAIADLGAPIRRGFSGALGEGDLGLGGPPAVPAVVPDSSGTDATRPVPSARTGVPASNGNGERATGSDGQSVQDDSLESGGASRAQIGPSKAGSGPIRPVPMDTGGEVHAELLVSGRAAPGTLLDLGGHDYRIGAGGRFSFRMPLEDEALIMRLLAALPRLPVDSRLAEEQAGEQGR